MDFPIPRKFWWSTDNLSASIFLQGVDQKILPCGQGRIERAELRAFGEGPRATLEIIG